MAKDLSPAQCVLLTVHFASESNIKALHSFTPTRLDALSPELILRILLTYLPESLEPKEYTTYIREVASRLYLDVERDEVEVDISPVKDISEEQAQKRVKRLQLKEVQPPSFPPHAPEDLLTRFLCHRAYRIDSETASLNLIPQLIEPFLDRNDYLRTWYISVVLPLLRLEYEYYSGEDSPSLGLADFERLGGKEGIEFLMQNAVKAKDISRTSSDSTNSDIARDVKGLVGPWMYGHTERERRKLGHAPSEDEAQPRRSSTSLSDGMRKISLGGVSADDKTGHDWEYFYRWMVFQAVENFPLITTTIDDWDGPGDVDLGGLNPGNSDAYLDEDLQSKLESQYAQAIFASCFAAQADSPETVKGAHGVLVRLALLLDFIPPPDLATSVDSLPKIEKHAAQLEESNTTADLKPDALLEPEHPLTTPRFETYMLLQMFVYSAYQFSGLEYPMSLNNVAKLHFYSSSDEQLAVLRKILRKVAKTGTRKDDAQWTADRAKLMWLWNWGIDIEDDNATTGAGVLGRIQRQDFEEEMLKCFTQSSCYTFAVNLYLKKKQNVLPRERIEHVVLQEAMAAYDSASNGNKTRGGVKKANDIISHFRPYFSDSIRFQQAIALINATHALSFYSLTLQHGVPFQPVSIRVSKDPLGLISKVLEQNSGSYTHLDDLISIGRNIVAAGLAQPEEDEDDVKIDTNDLNKRQTDAERRVKLMATEAALREDDFETAYSYIINRLTPSSMDIEAPRQHKRPPSRSSTTSAAAASDDDISWRAAFLAGRYRPSTSTPPTLRRLEQRTELLSLALLLAPVSALTDILAAWRRCEEEMTSLQLAQQQAEEEFDDRADKRQSMASLPGNFTLPDSQPDLLMNQKRREMGRMTGGKAGADEAPVSMFDLTRSAAQALSRNAFPLRVVSRVGSGASSGGLEASTGSLRSGGDDGQQSIRKRDMVASAVQGATGSLATGLGWVLGATPVDRQQH